MYLGDTKADIPGRGVALGQRTASQEHVLETACEKAEKKETKSQELSTEQER